MKCSTISQVPTFGWLGCSWKTMGTLWLSWGFNPLQGDPQWHQLVVATQKMSPFKKCLYDLGSHFWGLNTLNPQTWLKVIGMPGSRPWLGVLLPLPLASRDVEWTPRDAGFERLSTDSVSCTAAWKYSVLFCVYGCSYYLADIDIFCLHMCVYIYNISIVLLLIIIIVIIITIIIIKKIIIYIYVQLIMHAQLYNNYIVYTQIVDAKFRLLVLQKPKTAS